jgi:hypothetical protein
MRKPTSISSRMRPFVVVFVFLAFVFSSTNISGLVYEIAGLRTSKACHGFCKNDTQLPFEENEKEIEKTEGKKEHDSFLTFIIRATSLFAVIELTTFHSKIDTGLDLASVHLPLYLLKKSLLI